MRKADQREAAEMLRRILDAVQRGELTADTPEERRNVRRLEGMLAALEDMGHRRTRWRRDNWSGERWVWRLLLALLRTCILGALPMSGRVQPCSSARVRRVGR